jgi:hypothetical protein
MGLQDPLQQCQSASRIFQQREEIGYTEYFKRSKEPTIPLTCKISLISKGLNLLVEENFIHSRESGIEE